VFLADKFSLQEGVSSPVESYHCRGSIDSLAHHPSRNEGTMKLKAFEYYNGQNLVKFLLEY
jgi:hypothetical protein